MTATAALGCAHSQAEPVVLSTGETVASVCVGCLAGLATDYIDRQRGRAEREAFCTHDDLIEMTSLGELPWSICTQCGANQ